MIRTREIQSDNEMNLFINFPNILYSVDPCYVPPLFSFQKKLFDKNKNPFFLHSEVAFFLAYRDGEITGRIAGTRNDEHIKTTGEMEGFFGFFDCFDDPETAAALLDTVSEWLAKQGISKMTGPENFSTNEICGILTKGFTDPPIFMMPYNKPYYERLLTGYGLVKAMELASYSLAWNSIFRQIESYSTKVEARLETKGIYIRPIILSRFKEDMQMMHEAYNQSFRGNWGFVPLTREEFMDMADQLREITKPETILMATLGEKCLGFIVTVPDINQILIHIKNGKLFPFGIFKLLKYKKKINRYRILIMGVVPEHRKTGIDLCLIARASLAIQKLGIYTGEAAYIMDDNSSMIRILEKLKASPVKHYAIYTSR
jgi:hypothetical protein